MLLKSKSYLKRRTVRLVKSVHVNLKIKIYAICCLALNKLIVVGGAL